MTSGWHEARRSIVGCSELAALFSGPLTRRGEHVHKTRWQLWMEKAGRLAPDPGNDATELGQIFESGVLELVKRRTGIRIVPWTHFAPASGIDGAHIMAPDAAADILLPTGVTCVETFRPRGDGLVETVRMLVDESGLCGSPDAIGVTPDGDLVVVDAKTVGVFAIAAWRNDEGSVELPASYQLQGQGYCLLTGLKRALFGALRWPTLLPFWVEPDHTVGASIKRHVRAFIASLPTETSPGTEPALDFDLDADAVREVYGHETPGKALDAREDERLRTVLTQLAAARRVAAELEKDAKALAAEALTLIGDAETVRYEDGAKATVKRSADSPGKLVTPEMVGTYINARTGSRAIRFGNWKE